jgi:hypothetical protein
VSYHDQWIEEQAKWPQAFPEQNYEMIMDFLSNTTSNLELSWQPPKHITRSECIQNLRARFYFTLQEIHLHPICKPNHNYKYLKGEIRLYRTKKNIRYDIGIQYDRDQELIVQMKDNTPYKQAWECNWIMQRK